MNIFVEKEQCIGCGACSAICPDVFVMSDEGYAIADSTKITEENKNDVLSAMEGCPTGAIKEQK